MIKMRDLLSRLKNRFWINGYLNKETYRFWSKDQLQAEKKLPMHSEKVTDWFDLWASLDRTFSKTLRIVMQHSNDGFIDRRVRGQLTGGVDRAI